jgi:hypothetical protein
VAGILLADVAGSEIPGAPTPVLRRSGQGHRAYAGPCLMSFASVAFLIASTREAALSLA